jgi:hypothetical protein
MHQAPLLFGDKATTSNGAEMEVVAITTRSKNKNKVKNHFKELKRKK